MQRREKAPARSSGDGIACLELHTKMNTVDVDLTTMLDKA